jgi:hypothetical protein
VSLKLVPFHNTVNVRVEPLVLVTVPTATQSVAVTHDTPERVLVPTFGRPGIDQVEPFQRSTNVAAEPFEPILQSPTATQKFSAVHDTSRSLSGP